MPCLNAKFRMNLLPLGTAYSIMNMPKEIQISGDDKFYINNQRLLNYQHPEEAI